MDDSFSPDTDSCCWKVFRKRVRRPRISRNSAATCGCFCSAISTSSRSVATSDGDPSAAACATSGRAFVLDDECAAHSSGVDTRCVFPMGHFSADYRSSTLIRHRPVLVYVTSVYVMYTWLS